MGGYRCVLGQPPSTLINRRKHDYPHQTDYMPAGCPGFHTGVSFIAAGTLPGLHRDHRQSNPSGAELSRIVADGVHRQHDKKTGCNQNNGIDRTALTVQVLLILVEQFDIAGSREGVSQEKYADEVPYAFLRQVTMDRRPCFLLLNKASDDRGGPEIGNALRSKERRGGKVSISGCRS